MSQRTKTPPSLKRKRSAFASASGSDKECIFFWVFLCFFLANSLFAQSTGTLSRQPDSAAISQLRRALAATYPSPAERDGAIKQSLTELRALADLQRAATLME